MKRIIWHWTAGGHKASGADRKHYHFIVEGNGAVVNGNLAPEANLSTQDGEYAAHTLNCNTGSIGIAVAAMRGAIASPFSAGPSPITPAQVMALVALTRKLARQYGIAVSRETILGHAEVQPTLKITQRGKWDISWLPEMDKPGNPVEVGDKLRGMVSVPVSPASPSPPSQHMPDPAEIQGFWAALIMAIMGIIRGRK